jgi:hypothetical protein
VHGDKPRKFTVMIVSTVQFSCFASSCRAGFNLKSVKIIYHLLGHASNLYKISEFSFFEFFFGSVPSSTNFFSRSCRRLFLFKAFKFLIFYYDSFAHSSRDFFLIHHHFTILLPFCLSIVSLLLSAIQYMAPRDLRCFFFLFCLSFSPSPPFDL